MISRQLMAAGGGRMKTQASAAVGFVFFGATLITGWFALLIPALCFASITVGDLWLRLRKLQQEVYAEAEDRD